MPYRDPEKRRTYQRERFWENPEKYRAQHRAYYYEHRERSSELYSKNRDKRLARRRELDALIKLDVLSYYSKNGKPECSICSMADIDVLNIDHTNGGGRKHREEISGNALGQCLYRWLKRNNYPEGYQTLCANCNLKKAIENKRRERRQL